MQLTRRDVEWQLQPIDRYIVDVVEDESRCRERPVTQAEVVVAE